MATVANSSAAVKFVGSDADGLPLKRKQVQQACLSCRKKKKRCVHAITSSPPETKAADPTTHATDPPPLDSSPTRGGGAESVASQAGDAGRSLEEDICQVAATQLVELSSRFVGDLNPEGIFIEATTRKETAPGPNEIGIWLSTRSESGKDSVRSPELPHRGQQRLGSHHQYRSPRDRPGSLFSDYERAKARYLSEECLVTVPPPSDYAVLHQIYMDKVHPIFPVFTDSDLAGTNPDSVYCAVLKQVIALIGGLDPSARNHLRLEAGGPLLRPQDFHQRLSDAICPVLDADWIQSRVDHISILTTMALFYQPFDATQRDRAPSLNTQAVHQLLNLSAHLAGYQSQRPGEDIDRVFCAVWAVDRLCASFYARPTMIHERDIERDLSATIEKQPPCFRLFLRLIQTLDGIFPLYRPHQRVEYTDIPILESLVIDTGTARTPTRLLATLETLYHGISVLSCRQPRSAFNHSLVDEESRLHLPSATINPRRSLSADRIKWIVENEDLGPFPFVPYALSLALSVQYRKMRYSRTVMFRNRARGMFQDIVTELRKLGDFFFSARVNAGLGDSILREMEKTATSLCRDELDHNGAASSAAGSIARGATPTVGGGPQGSGVASRAGHAGPAATVASASTTNGHFADAPMGGIAPAAAVASQSGGYGSHGSTALPNHDAVSVFDSYDVDLDLFGYFDPNFNLGAVDTALEANLNIGFPQTWTGEAWNYAGA